KGGIFHGLDELSRRHLIIDQWCHHALRTAIEKAVDHMRFASWRAHEGGCPATFARPREILEIGWTEAAMFCIEDQEVPAGHSQQLSLVRIGIRIEHPEKPLPFPQTITQRQL